MSTPMAAFGPDSVPTKPTFTLSAACAGKPSASAHRRIIPLMALLLALYPLNLQFFLDDAAALDYDLAVQRHRAVAHRHVVMPARIALAAALRIRPGGEEEISREGARRSALALGQVAVQRNAVPQRLRVHAPAQVRHRVRVAILRRTPAVVQPVAHQLGVRAAVDLDDMALADLEPNRVGDVAAVRQDNDVARLQYDRAVRAALVREGVDMAAAPVVEVPALVGVAPLRHDGILAAGVGEVGAGGGFGFPHLGL